MAINELDSSGTKVFVANAFVNFLKEEVDPAIPEQALLNLCSREVKAALKKGNFSGLDIYFSLVRNAMSRNTEKGFSVPEVHTLQITVINHDNRPVNQFEEKVKRLVMKLQNAFGTKVARVVFSDAKLSEFENDKV